MNSLREIIESSPQMRGLAMHSLRGEDTPQPLAAALWDWQNVRRVLVIRLRSIGDTVLSTPSLFALKRFLPHAEIDILLEDWVAPVLDGYPHVDNVITMARRSPASRARVARQLRANRYDVVYNLHGGTTATLLARATGARHRIGYASYQYAGLHNHLSPSSALLWGRDKTHSVEQQLALLGWTGVPVSDRPPTELAVTKDAAAAVAAELRTAGLEDRPLGVIHPAAAFATKQWAADNFGSIAEELARRGLAVVVITTAKEAGLVDAVKQNASAPVLGLTDLTLPEVTALLARARLFVGNDSGIAHIAAAVQAPAVVIFGSSNVAHWRPWARVAAEIVREEMECQPCHGYFCEKFPEPECIKRVPVDRVMAAAERVLRESAGR
ncbi:MAG TPA: putative lipopolysaccharide heptosyltransferase III [Blastocatellia bacterium]|nr:putative lipopolysaccharide heptosyltransferase III [Blastocatellia bacterium]HAF22978.1 putative lipopolysaccharide heptosyltransferase III [Blastocatellia bacterium]